MSADKIRSPITTHILDLSTGKAAAGVEVMCWFSAHDAVDGPMGLVRSDGVRRNSYFAFKTMTAELSNYRLVRQVAGLNTPTVGLQAFLFEGPQGRKLVAWSADGTARNLLWPRAASLKPIVSVLGRRLSLGNTPRRVIIGAAPVYIPANWTDADLNASLTAAA